MSKQRKLQSEIEQTLKRLNEGVDDWDGLWDKLEETEDPSQREKIVNEMKRELKKLQRLREQVRGWAASGEVKDDTRLTDARKAVEREMERFKNLERELKIKQFSSEGLMRDSNDPVMVAKVQCADWINDAVTLLETQVEQFEADLEALGPPKGGRGKPTRVVELEGFIRKHQDHVTKLEQVLRLLENDQVTAEEVEGALRDGIDYYLTSSTDEDFMADDSMYDSLPLTQVDDSIGKITAHTPRAGGKGKDGGDEAQDGAPEGGKGKRSKGAKAGGKGKGGEGNKGVNNAAGKAAAAAAATAAAAVPPPPGLPPLPSSPSAASTPSTVTRTTSFKAVAATGIKPAQPAAAGAGGGAAGPAVDSAVQPSQGGPETPAQAAQGAAAITPPAGQRVHVASTQPGSPPQPAPAPAVAAATSPASSAPTSPPAAPIGETAGQAGPSTEQPQPMAALAAVQQPLSPASAARLGVFNEQMLLAAAAHQADQQARLQAQQAQGMAASPSLPVVEVPAGLPPLALNTGASGPAAGRHPGHSPLAALASAAASVGRQLSMDLPGFAAQAQGLRRIGSAAYASPAPHAGLSAFGPADLSPRSVHSNASVGNGSTDLDSRRRQAADMAASAAAAEFAAAAAAAATAGTAAGTPRGHEAVGAFGGGLGIPTVLSFNHLRSQAEAVLNLGAGEQGYRGAGASEDGTPRGSEGGAPCEAGGGEGQGGAPHLPWVPTLLDVQLLDTSVASRPQPGDGDWTLQEGGVSAAGTPPPAQRPVLTPGSFPNDVHPSLKQEETFRKLSAESAFFAFYFQQGTRQQLFAANALKSQGWRFHTQFNAWFARQSQPRVVTETHEQGPLIYFDSLLHNVTPPSPSAAPVAPVFNGWCPRVSRPDFIFEYKFMEQDDTSAPSDP